MKSNSQKFIFVLVVIVAVVFARMWYAGLSVYPANSEGIPGAASGTVRTGANPPHIVLAPPPAASSSSAVTSLTSADAADIPAAPTATQPYFGESDTTQSVFTRTGHTAVPQFGNESFLVEDLTNDVDLASVNQDVRWPTASLTKLMTATLVMDHFSMDTRITITPQMFAVDPDERTLVVNGTYTVSDLMHVMLMPSSNVAAEAFADFYGRTKFMAEMNARAQQWGMTSTYFDDPSGLSSANESSAHDLAILARHVYQDYPGILAFTDTPQITITELSSGAKVPVTSINHFAGQANFIGGKTGYIPEARDNLLSIFRYDGNPVLIIVLGAEDTAMRFDDTTKLLNWVTINYR